MTSKAVRNGWRLLAVLCLLLGGLLTMRRGPGPAEAMFEWAGPHVPGPRPGGRVAAERAVAAAIDEIRLSDMGADGTAEGDAYRPAVAYNSADDQYLVVWYGDDSTGGLVDGEYEIYGQRVDGATGAELGGDFRLSDMGPDGTAAYGASKPGVAYNSANNQYLVVWRGDDDAGGLLDQEFEIYGQRVDAATGAEIGTNDFRLSDMGPDASAEYGALSPVVAYNSANNQYLVVWRGDDDANGLLDQEFEIYGQRVDGATGNELGGDFRLSDMGPDASDIYGAFNPAVAYNSANNQYLVAWRGNDTVSASDNAFEIYGQRVDGATGDEIGTNDFQLSDMGPNGDVEANPVEPAVAYNSANNQFLVVWNDDKNTGGLVDGELEIYGQRVDGATGAELGGDLRLSDLGTDGNDHFDAARPSVAYNSAANEYLVVWDGDDDIGELVDNEFEIYGQRVAGATGAELGGDIRLSDMGPDGNAGFDALRPAQAFSTASNQYLVVWRGDENTGGLADDEFEIFARIYAIDFWIHMPLIVR